MLIKTLIILCVFALSVTEQCHDIGPNKVFYDSSCAHGGAGCNAGGQGQNCRFCGFDIFPACPGGGGDTGGDGNTGGGQTGGGQTTDDNTGGDSGPIGGRVPYGQQIKFRTVNNCPYTVWAGMQGRSKSQPGWRLPNDGGWELASGQSKIVTVPHDLYAARFWPRTGCRNVNGQFRCDTGDCGPWVKCAHDGIQRGGAPPVSLAEFTLESWHDYYDVSLVDGFSIKIQIKPGNPSAPNPGSANSHYWCNAPKCNQDLNQICPEELKKRNSAGQVVACMSACEKFGTDEYCCHGAHDRPETCKSTDWPKNYPAIFKQACPDAYSYAYDDHSSTFFCKETNYDVIFC